jgi:hypothetical protein
MTRWVAGLEVTTNPRDHRNLVLAPSLVCTTP